MASTDKPRGGNRHRLATITVVGVLALAGCGGSDDEPAAATPDRSVEVTATEYAFAGDPGEIIAGDTINFVLVNAGQVDHSLQVLNADGRRLGETSRISPGGRADVTVTFDDAGPYRLICDIDDHLSRGQSAGLTVIDG